MRRLLLVLLVLLFTIILCSCNAPTQSSTNQPQETVQAQVPTDDELIQGVRQAENLEKTMWEQANQNRDAGGPLRPANINTREDLVKFFEQGYGLQLATQVTNYWWTTDAKNQGILRATDPTAIEPENLVVESKTPEQAVVTGAIPETYRSIWGFKETKVSYILEKDKDHWIVTGMEFK